MTPGSPEFNAKWKQLATNPDFKNAEREFIAKTHAEPALAYAAEEGIPTEDPRVQEAIWSMSVQHGGVNNILRNTAERLTGEEPPEIIIKRLYGARRRYVLGLRNMNVNEKIRELNRYRREEQAVLEMNNDR